jgi:hypothetical protein
VIVHSVGKGADETAHSVGSATRASILLRAPWTTRAKVQRPLP